MGLFAAYMADYLERARTTRPDEPLFMELKRLRRQRASNGKKHAGVA